ncbi:natterin-4-like [Ornithodoros turicata]|uniref:natterin-4-like n=1 Tax=Ornithodoros turicata TaxID=34597 RepID=UPI00313A14EE
MSYYSRTNYRNLCHWVSTSGGNVPYNAVAGGEDSGEAIYIGRAEHDGDVVPGKIVPSHNVCYVPHGGREHANRSYQVLVSLDESQFDWVPQSRGGLPPGAVQGGVTESGEPLYIGRTFHEGSLTIGKIHCSHGCLYIPYGGVEHSYTSYEVLVCRTVNF